MNFARYFRASSYCLIASGFAALAATGALDVISILLFSMILAGSWFVNTDRLRQRTPSWAFNSLALAFLCFFALDYGFLSRAFLPAVLHLLMLAAAVKLLTLSKDRDYLQLYCISFAEVLAASALTVSAAFILCFVAFLFSGVSTLMLFEMRRSNARLRNEARVMPLVAQPELQGTGLELFAPFPARLVSATSIGITLLILLGAIPLFFLLPRATLGWHRQPSGETQFLSGFSDRVELGQIGAIKLSDAVVMRVKTDKSPAELPAGLKWRGLALEYYDGRAWSRSDTAPHPIPVQGLFYKLEDSAQGTDWMHQTFFVESLSTNVVFAARKALAISRDVGALHRDSGENLFAAQHLQKKLRYSAVSDLIRPDPARIFDQAPIPPGIRNTCLQLPALDPRIADLANRITQRAASRYAKARALEDYVRSHYAYSLTLRGTPKSRDPLAMFLFDVREGHCEYFASAMTVMLRQIGIPARLVNGFHIGEYNRIGRSWIVRRYHAHSWVEAYFPPYGWTEFDPTPMEPQQPQSAFLHLISNLTDAVDLWWWEGVVNYDSSQQYRVVRSLFARVDGFERRAGALWAFLREKGRTEIGRFSSPGFASAVLGKWPLWAPGLALASFLLIKPLRRRLTGLAKRAWRRGDARAVAASFYEEALSLLRAQGLNRARGQTPLEFAQALAPHPAGKFFLDLTRMYNAVRFGPPGARFSHSEADFLLRSLHAALRRAKSDRTLPEASQV